MATEVRQLVDLHRSDEQQQLAATLRRLLGDRLAAVVELLPDTSPVDRDRTIADAQTVGLIGLGLPEEFGGLGTFADLAVAHEELGRGLAPSLLTTLSVATRLAWRAGADRELLTALVDGRLPAGVAIDEDESRDRPAALRRDGDGFRLAGSKVCVVDGLTVDELLVTARSEVGRTALVRLPADSAGTRRTAASSPTDIPHVAVTFDDVAVPADRVLGADVEAAVSRWRLDTVVLAAARQLGGGRAVLERTVEHVRTRVQFDRPIGSFQAVQHQLADVATELDAAGLAVAQAAWAVDGGVTGGELDRLSALAAVAAGAAFRRATLVAHQLHGGMGFVLDSPLHLWSARAAADPTVPLPRRHLLDRLADASGIGADRVVVPADHRAS